MEARTQVRHQLPGVKPPTELLREFTQLSKLFEKKIETLTATNPTDRLVMESLIQRGPLSPSELAEAVQITPAAMTASVDRLIEMGHVNRNNHPTDRRKLVINASEASVAIIMNELLAMVVDVNSVLKDFTKKETATITRFLEQVNAAYSRHTA